MSPWHAALYLTGGRGSNTLIRAWVTDWEFSGRAGRLLSVYQLAKQLSVILHHDLGGVLYASAPNILKRNTRQVQLKQSLEFRGGKMMGTHSSTCEGLLPTRHLSRTRLDGRKPVESKRIECILHWLHLVNSKSSQKVSCICLGFNCQGQASSNSRILIKMNHRPVS